MKKTDYIIIFTTCFFLGVFIVSQYYAGGVYKKATKEENNAVLALEVSRASKSNSDLRQEVKKLTANLDSYRNSSQSEKSIYDQYTNESTRLDYINGVLPTSGQGVIINIEGVMDTPQLVDLINSIRNIGTDYISLNDQRILVNTGLSKFTGMKKYDIKIMGNSQLFQSALTRKGGIVEQILTKDLKISVITSENIEIPSGELINLNYAKIVK